MRNTPNYSASVWVETLLLRLDQRSEENDEERLFSSLALFSYWRTVIY
jgi:hypothetical protein